MNASSRIAVNTVATYGRLLAVAGVGFAAVPIALRTLGSTDYGIYSVLGGSLAFLLFINGALTAGAERHFAHAIGRNDDATLSKWFTASVCIHLVWGCLMALSGLLAESWIIHHALHLPEARMAAAAWVYRVVLLTMVTGVISTPFQAILMAHELIAIQAGIGIVGALCFLAGIFLLPHLPGDHLINYAMIYSSNQLFVFVTPILFVLVRYKSCRTLSPEGLRGKSMRELIGFSSWNLFGALGGTVRSQGPAILINRSFGPAINASYGIALQVNGSVMNLSSAVYRATIPQIIKSHANGNQQRMVDLACLCSKYSYLLLWGALAPILFNANFCLSLWLHRPPNYVATFFILLSVTLLIDQLTSGFLAVVQAVGDLAMFQMTTSTLMCCGIPLGYVLVRFGMSPSSILAAGIVAAVLLGLAQWWFAYRLGKVPPKSWLKQTMLPVLLVTVVSGVLLEALQLVMASGWLRLFAGIAVVLLVVPVLVWRVGSDERERQHLGGMFRSVMRKLRLSPSLQLPTAPDQPII